MPSIKRPVRGPLQVRLPYRPNGVNFQLLESTCGVRSKIYYECGVGIFIARRKHLDSIIHAILRVRAAHSANLTRGHADDVQPQTLVRKPRHVDGLPMSLCRFKPWDRNALRDTAQS